MSDIQDQIIQLAQIYFKNQKEKIVMYDVNEENALRFIKIKEYFDKISSSKGGQIEYLTKENDGFPSEICIRFTEDLVVGEENEKEVEEFTNIIALCDGISIAGTGLEDGSFTISLFVKDVYIPRK